MPETAQQESPWFTRVNEFITGEAENWRHRTSATATNPHRESLGTAFSQVVDTTKGVLGQLNPNCPNYTFVD